MARKVKKDLFNLIKALSKAEERFIRSYLKRNSSKDSIKYITLFETILKQSKFDEFKQKQKTYGKGGTSQSIFSQLKKYLYDLILKGLLSYDEKNNTLTNTKLQALKVESLFRRSLYEEGQELAKEVIDIADKQELYDVSIALNMLVFDNALEVGDLDFLCNQIHSLKSKMNLLIETKKTEVYLWYQNTKHLFDLKHLGIGKHNNKKEDDDQKISSQSKRLNHLNLLRLFHLSFLNNDLKNSETIALKLVSLFFEERLTFNELKARDKLIMSLYVQKKYRQCLEELKIATVRLNRHPLNSYSTIKYKERFIYFQLIIFNSLGLFSNGIELLKSIQEKGSFKWEESELTNNFVVTIVSLFFGNGDFDKAMNWINYLKLNKKANYRQDILHFVNWIELFLHIELNNKVLLESLLRAFKRKVGNTRYKQPKVEKIIYRLIQQVVSALDKQDEKNAFIDFKNKLTECFKDPNEREIQSLFHILSWAESKIINKSFEQVASKMEEKKFI